MEYKKPSVNTVDINNNRLISTPGCKKYCNLDYGLSGNMCSNGHCGSGYCARKYTF